MKRFIETLKNIYQVEELRNRIITTLGLIILIVIVIIVIVVLRKKKLHVHNVHRDNKPDFRLSNL